MNSHSRRYSSSVNASCSITLRRRLRADPVRRDLDREHQKRSGPEPLRAARQRRQCLGAADLGQDLDCGRADVRLELGVDERAKQPGPVLARQRADQLAREQAHVGILVVDQLRNVRPHGAFRGPQRVQRTRAQRGIVGAQQRSAVATLVERKMRLTLLIRLPYGHSAQHVGDALITTFTQLPVKLGRTLTWDQGNEMFHHQRIEAATGLKIYFADPHSPWQRGSNENTNGLVRQYLPKGTDLSVWNDIHLRQIADELNDRPRLCLNDKTPTELLQRWERQYTPH